MTSGPGTRRQPVGKWPMSEPAYDALALGSGWRGNRRAPSFGPGAPSSRRSNGVLPWRSIPRCCRRHAMIALRRSMSEQPSAPARSVSCRSRSAPVSVWPRAAPPGSRTRSSSRSLGTGSNGRTAFDLAVEALPSMTVWRACHGRAWSSWRPSPVSGPRVRPACRPPSSSAGDCWPIGRPAAWRSAGRAILPIA